MTIEYTYPERPTKAVVNIPESGNRYILRAERNELDLSAANCVDFPDVPEVCEAMMTLAGHEWPVKAVYSAPNEDVLKAAAERIIARLKPLKEDKLPDELDGFAPHRWALIQAIEIVRKECGL